MLAKVHDAISDNLKAASSHEKELASLGNLLKRVQLSGDSYSGMDMHQGLSRKERREVRKAGIQRYWGSISEYVSSEKQREIENEVDVVNRNAHFDCAAVLGLLVSMVLCVVYFAPGGVANASDLNGKTIVLYAVGLSLMGLTGTIARSICLTPIVEKDETAELFVPPIFAVRPIMFLAIMWIVINVPGMQELLHGFGTRDLSEEAALVKDTGWRAGAVVALFAALLAWGSAFFTRMQERRRKEP